MNKSESRQKAENLVEELSAKFPMSREQNIDIALFMVEKILQEQPTYRYWDTFSDETPSAVTVWNEVKTELYMMKSEAQDNKS